MWGLFVGAAAAALAPAGPGALIPLKMAIASADSVGNDVYVAVIVDFGNGSTMTTVSKCVPVAANAHDADALAAAVGSENVGYANSGLLCAIDNYPPNGVENCGESVGSGNYDYWSYWHGSTGSWVYADDGPAEQSVSSPADDVEGWRFQLDEPDTANAPAPAVTPSYSQICNASTEVPPQGPAAPAPTTTTTNAPAAPSVTPTTAQTSTGSTPGAVPGTAASTKSKSGNAPATTTTTAAGKTTSTLASGGSGGTGQTGNHGSSDPHRPAVASAPAHGSSGGDLGQSPPGRAGGAGGRRPGCVRPCPMASSAGRGMTRAAAPRRRSLHPVAWWLWAAGLAICAMRTNNPFLLALIGVVACVVVSAASQQRAVVPLHHVLSPARPLRHRSQDGD